MICEVKIRIMKTEEQDLPVKEITYTAEWLQEKEREHFKRTKAKFED
jgi:hypothetical protein